MAKIHREFITRTKYLNIHQWLRRHHGKAYKCENNTCEGVSIKFEWALKKGYSHHRDVNNYMMMCKKCHQKYDYNEEWRAKVSSYWIGKPKLYARKPVKQLTKEGVLVREYSGAIEASKITGITVANLSQALNEINKSGSQKTAGGFKWVHI